MRSPSRGRFESFLTSHNAGVLCLADGDGPWAMPVRYRNRELSVACVVPRWAEIAYRLEQSPTALLIVPTEDDASRAWLACRGPARLGEATDWPNLFPSVPGSTPVSELYQLVEITTRRLDLVDERDGWGQIDNLDL